MEIKYSFILINPLDCILLGLMVLVVQDLSKIQLFYVSMISVPLTLFISIVCIPFVSTHGLHKLTKINYLYVRN